MSENIPNENISILIVEDEPKIARFTQLELEHEGFRTSIEGNGRRAYERIIQEDYDVVLLDVMLPEMDGFEICQKVRELSDVPIIMLTARDDIEDKVNGLDIGADDYLTKPFAIKELLARIRLILRRIQAVCKGRCRKLDFRCPSVCICLKPLDHSIRISFIRNIDLSILHRNIPGRGKDKNPQLSLLRSVILHGPQRRIAHKKTSKNSLVYFMRYPFNCVI